MRTFVPFRITGVTGRRSAERTRIAGLDTVVLRATSGEGEEEPFVSEAPTVNPVRVSVHAALPAHDVKTRSLWNFTWTRHDTSWWICLQTEIEDYILYGILRKKTRQKNINFDIIFLTLNVCRNNIYISRRRVVFKTRISVTRYLYLVQKNLANIYEISSTNVTSIIFIMCTNAVESRRPLSKSIEMYKINSIVPPV